MRLLTSLVVLAVMAGAAGAATPRPKIARAIAPVLRDPKADGLLIYDIEPESQADKAGLRIGDILKIFDGQPVTTKGELVRLGQAAARERRSGILAVVQRGDESVEAMFDPAPLGVHLVEVRAGVSRPLWSRPTRFEPDFSGVQQRMSQSDHWDLLMHGDVVVGWRHVFFARQGDLLFMRAQTRIVSETQDRKLDVTLSYTADKTFTPKSIRLVSADRLVLELAAADGKFQGHRVGIPVEADLPDDALSVHLAAEVATTLPQKEGASLRCSYLDTASMVAAPFSDLTCMGKEQIAYQARPVDTYRYRQSVFGSPVADFWIDEQRNVIKCRYRDGIEAVAASRTRVLEQFPHAEQEFPEIHLLTKPKQPETPRAN
ncbi:hypothetical protein Pan216_50570 [Planctomycetes bacterium Pan216]|uniref:PDZ domain-containing protein n=1 Tax=Kolteria novifilia TaxID=2527975 RepID=A0A518BB13_9BACT|nr:hypothetical protein Pan216_50570 [Planctomycetes bacterium Pan216]